MIALVQIVTLLLFVCVGVKGLVKFKPSVSNRHLVRFTKLIAVKQDYTNAAKRPLSLVEKIAVSGGKPISGDYVDELIEGRLWGFVPRPVVSAVVTLVCSYVAYQICNFFFSSVIPIVFSLFLLAVANRVFTFFSTLFQKPTAKEYSDVVIDFEVPTAAQKKEEVSDYIDTYILEDKEEDKEELVLASELTNPAAVLEMPRMEVIPNFSAMTIEERISRLLGNKDTTNMQIEALKKSIFQFRDSTIEATMKLAKMAKDLEKIQQEEDGN